MRRSSAASARSARAASPRRGCAPPRSRSRTGTPASTFLCSPCRQLPQRVAPGLDRVPVPAVAGQLDVARPAVVLDRPHRRLVPGLLVVGTQEERGVEQVVAVGEDVGGDEQLVADDALDRVAAAVELRADALDHDAAPRADLAGVGLARVGHGLRPRAARSPSSSSWLWRNPTRSATMGPMKAVPASRSALLLALRARRMRHAVSVGRSVGRIGPARRPSAASTSTAPEPTPSRPAAPAERADRRRPAAAGPRGGRDGPGCTDQHHRHAGRLAARQRAGRPGGRRRPGVRRDRGGARHHRPRARRAASRACSAWRSTPTGRTTRAPTSTTRPRGRRRHRALRVPRHRRRRCRRGSIRRPSACC